MDPIIAVYSVKLTVRSSSIDNVGLTNDQVGQAIADGLVEAIARQEHDADGAAEVTIDVNATSVERTDS